MIVPSDMAKQTEKPLLSLSKGLTLLLKVRELSRPVGLSEATRLLRFNKATTYRVLRTLEQYGFLERNAEEKKYGIGINAFFVGSAYFSAEKNGVVRKIMRRIVEESGHTVTMSVLNGTSVMFVDRQDGVGRVVVSVKIGSRVPAYCSASGKAMLAQLTREEIQVRLKAEKFKRYTPKTITCLDRLETELAAIRARGFAVNHEESVKGLCALAVPVKSRGAFHLAALTVAYPAGSLSKSDEHSLAKKLQIAAAEIEKAGLGQLETSSSSDE